jgi:hypothetical protein
MYPLLLRYPRRSPDDASGNAPPAAPPAQREPPIREVHREIVHASEDSPGVKARIDKQQARIDALESELAPLRTSAAALTAERDDARARLAATAARHAAERALDRGGVTDEEDQAEFRERYARVEPDAEGKRPEFGGWFDAIKTSRPKWSRPYLPEPVEDGAEPPPVAPPAAGASGPPAYVPPPVVRANPSGGRSDAAAPPPPRQRFTEAVVARMSEKEFLANRAAIEAEAIAAGEMQAPRKRPGT